MLPLPRTLTLSSTLRLLALLAQLSIAGSLLAQAGSGAITTELLAQKIVMVKTTDGSRIEKFEPISSIVPGDVIRYTVTFANKAAEPITGIVVSLPLPREMTLAEPVKSTPEITATYSIDGGTHFAPLDALSVTDSEGRTRPASLADVTHLNWSIASVLAPSTSGSVSCRAILK